VAKVHINGESFAYDRSHKPLSEMMALERALAIPYAQWEADLTAGSARALAAFCWLIWRRDGRDVPFADIESGAVEIDYNSIEFELDGDQKPEAETDPTPDTPGPNVAPRVRQNRHPAVGSRALDRG
jgi:hypothetical protein